MFIDCLFTASVVGDGDLAFYKELAERRREALNDSLKENESLVSENAELRHRNYELNNENQSLQESVEKANNLAKMLEVISFSIHTSTTLQQIPKLISYRPATKPSLQGQRNIMLNSEIP